MKNFSYILPYYKEESQVMLAAKAVLKRSSGLNIKQVIICKNGGKPSKKLLSDPDIKGVSVLSTFDVGLGAGYKLGINAAESDFVVLTASDLPFGFSDINSFWELGNKSNIDIAIGSKGHKDSRVRKRSLKRLIATFVFKYLRKLILGFNQPNDSQGTIIVKSELAKKIISSYPCSDGFEFSLDFLTYALEFEGVRPLELPISLNEGHSKSSVNVVRLGFSMTRRMLFLYNYKRRRRG